MSLFSTLKSAISKTSSSLIKGIATAFTKKRLNQETLDSLSDSLLMADLGAITTSKIISSLAEKKISQDLTVEEIKSYLADLIYEFSFNYDTKPLELSSSSLNVITLCGVNGNGKTTTVGKLAAYFALKGKKVAIAACDTFRAGAVDQALIWAERVGVTLLQERSMSDPAAVAFKAIEESLDKGVEVLLIDTAGRLHNYENLMREFQKIIKVVQRFQVSHHNILVLDATTGQNALSQVEHFDKFSKVHGLIITKLDSSSKAGVVINISEKFKLPIYFIGVGEGVKDLIEFNSKDFIQALLQIA